MHILATIGWRLLKRHVFPSVLLACCAVGMGGQSSIQPGKPDKETPPGLTEESILAEIRKIEQSSELDAAAKKKVIAIYQDALLELKAAATARALASKFSEQAASVKKEIVETIKQRTSLPKEPDVRIPESASLAELQSGLNTALEKLAKAKEEYEKWEKEPSRRAERIKKIPEELKQANDRLKEVEKQLAIAEKAKGLVAAANKTFLQAKKLALEANIEALEKERRAYVATVELLPIRRALAADLLVLAEAEVRAWQTALSQRRRQEVELQIELAREALRQAPPEYKAVAQKNLELSLRRKEIRDRMEQVARELELAKKTLESIRSRRERMQERIKAVGLTNVIGQLLLAERAALPKVGEFRRRNRTRQETLQQLRLELFNLEESRAALDKLDKIVARYPNRDQAMVYFDRQQRYLDKLIADLSTYLFEVVKLDSLEKQVVQEVSETERYIKEHVLWIASAAPLSLEDVERLPAALAWLADWQQWNAVREALVEDALEHWLGYSLAILLLVGLWLATPRLKRVLRHLGDRVRQRGWNEFGPTLQALMVTVLLASALPAPLYFLGWRLSVAQSEFTLPAALGEALIIASRSSLLFSLIYHLCRAGGVADAHFGWSNAQLRRIRRFARLVAFVLVPLVFGVALFQFQPNPVLRNSVGRLLFLAAMPTWMLLAIGLFRPKNGLIYRSIPTRTEGLFHRMGKLWCLVGIAVPGALALITGLGYYYTAWQIALRVEESIWLLLCLFLLGALLFRWALIARRWLALYQARRRQQAQAETAEVTESGAERERAIAEVTVDLTQVNEQTRRLLMTILFVAGALGLWLIWVDIVPALSFLDQIHLWTKTVTTAVGGDGEALSTPIEKVVPVSLLDLVMALVIAVLAIVAIRNVPGLLQLIALERLPLDAGLRFTITTISRYVIALAAILFVGDRVGLAWSSMQWLVAALMVGLGFGLQEIFANFVSGIILLIERPIRVGDIVTVGNTSGTVTNIQMRATTIRDWNRRELIVPNRKLVTDELVNWTLSDAVYRVDLPVGIAYGSDTERAREILLDIAAKTANVLPEPKPKAIFKKFGDSTLDFELRICIPNIDYWPSVVTAVNSEIHRRFAEAGIEIAFPQRDLHIRSIGKSEPKLEMLVPILRGEERTSNGKEGSDGNVASQAPEPTSSPSGGTEKSDG